MTPKQWVRTCFEVAIRSAAIGLGVISAPALCAAEEPLQEPRLVRQVDHILIASSDAKGLFTLLSDTLQFPVAWPMSDYGGFSSGGVAVGNVNLEVLKASGSPDSATRSSFVGFALEPEPLRTTLPELAARKISHGAPAPFRSRKPSESGAILWTSVALPGVSSDAIEVFFCEYGQDVGTRRRRLLEELQSRDGGPLSVRSIKEIVIGASDLKRLQEEWARLLGPLQASSQGVWAVGSGPAIRLTQADKDEILGVVVNVKSLPQARRFLKTRGLLGADLPAALKVAGSRLEGLSITLVEQPPEGS